MIARDELQRHKKRMCIDYSQTINLFTELDAYPLPRIDDVVNKLSQYKVFSTFDLKSAYRQIPLRESETKFTVFEALGDLYEFVVLPFGSHKWSTVFSENHRQYSYSRRSKEYFPFTWTMSQ